LHIKFLKHGKGSIKKAVDYLMRERDHKNEKRPQVRVLKGNPNLMKKLEPALKNKHKYRSAVIAFAPEDQPTDEQISEVLAEFERVAFAGLEKNQYSFLAVDHGDHIHIIAPRIELTTGKSMNIAPPNWEKTYDPIRDYFNTKYNWKSPNIELYPQNKRIAPIEQLELPKEVKRAKIMINDAVLEQIEKGVIKNRADIKSYLAQIGEITREGKDYISLKPFGFKKAIRLKGAIFEKKFDIGRIAKEGGGDEREKYRGVQTSRNEELEKLEQTIKRIVNKRAQYNRSRYKRGLERNERADADDQGRADADKQKELDSSSIDRLAGIGRNYTVKDEATTGDDRKRSEIVAGKKLSNNSNLEWVATDREKKGRIIDDGIGRIAYATIERIRISREKSAKSGKRKGRAIGSIDVQNSATKQPDYRAIEQFWEQRRRRRFRKAFEVSIREFEQRLGQLIGKIDQTIAELENRLKAIPKIKPEIKPAPGPKKSNFSGLKL